MTTALHSIRWRVQLWHGLILLLVVVAFCVTSYRLAWDNLQRRIDRSLFDAEHALMGGLMRSADPDAVQGRTRPPPVPPEVIVRRLRDGTITLPRDVASRFEGSDVGHAYYVILSSERTVLLKSVNARLDLAGRPPVSAEPGGDAQTVGTIRQLGRTMADGSRIVVGRDITQERDELRRFSLSLAARGLAVWLLGLLGGWWLAGRAIKPIATISQTATRIAAGNLEERISTEGTDSELDQLSRVLNETFDRLQATVQQQKQFTADASHELRTPVTILLAETRRALKRARTPDEYQEVIRTCAAAGVRMQRLIEQLLLLAHQDNPTGAPGRPSACCDLAPLATGTVEHLGPLAKEHSVELHATLAPAACLGDPSSLSILINNLVANAIQHHGGAGHVWIMTGADRQDVFLEVRDDGPGIAGEDLPHIFERFYRADRARTAGPGHSGLGLAIVKTIADNHHGQVTVQSGPGEGACFRFTLRKADGEKR